ncbi:hypothetical protein CEXT_505831 [Caerostris extrusa]|uniref:Uncharacterized protein n=1 Tax=Caerostris extrusa TaxID=172846 RepID=A0AAV4MF27_CAEEX|nr:hypothetical protein CEXT_505831 [Caerostris extrusa]
MHSTSFRGPPVGHSSHSELVGGAGDSNNKDETSFSTHEPEEAQMMSTPPAATTHDGCRINSTRNCSVIGTRGGGGIKKTTVSLTNSDYLCCLVKARNGLVVVIHLATLPVLVCSAMCDDDLNYLRLFVSKKRAMRRVLSFCRMQ